MNGMLLAAGLGTRFRPLTETVPKPAIPFLGVPLIGFMLYEFEQVGLSSLVVNTHHLPEKVEACVRSLTKEKNYPVHFSFEKKILGSGGGIRAAEKFLTIGDLHVGPPSKYLDKNGKFETLNIQEGKTQNFLVANGDEVILFADDQGLKKMIDFHKSQNALVTLLTTEHKEAGKKLGGVWVSESARKNNFTGPIAKLGGQGSDPFPLHFAGVYVFSSRVFEYMPPQGEFHIFRDALHKAMAANEKVLSYYDPNISWFDMSSQTDYDDGTKAATKILEDKNSFKAKRLNAIQRRFAQI